MNDDDNARFIHGPKAVVSSGKGMKPTVHSRALALSMVIVLIIVSATASIMYAGDGNTSMPVPRSIDPRVEKNGDCYLVDADLYKINSYDPPTISYLMDVTSKVKWQDSKWISFNRNYLVRVVFSGNLINGDIVRMYARYSTTPMIKAVVLSTTDFSIVGGGEVSAMWGYYNLTLDNLTTPQSIFYIYIPSNPSCNNIRIDEIKCYCTTPVLIPEWREPDTGFGISNYTFNINYLVTATGNVNYSEVYLDITLFQKIINQLDNTTIIGDTMIERTLYNIVPNVNGSYSSRELVMVSHDIVMVNNITIILDVSVTVKARVQYSDDWIVVTKTFTGVRSFSAWWY
jgi:hypothetical protein